MKKLSMISMLVVVSLSVSAADYRHNHISHNCTAPIKALATDAYWYNSEVDQYKDCIQDFINNQNQAIDAHNKAAKNAVNEWNNFVNYGH